MNEHCSFRYSQRRWVWLVISLIPAPLWSLFCSHLPEMGKSGKVCISGGICIFMYCVGCRCPCRGAAEAMWAGSRWFHVVPMDQPLDVAEPYSRDCDTTGKTYSRDKMLNGREEKQEEKEEKQPCKHQGQRGRSRGIVPQDRGEIHLEPTEETIMEPTCPARLQFSPSWSRRKTESENSLVWKGH